MPNVLITGASRGIGLGLTKFYAQLDKYHVYACVRSLDSSGDLRMLLQQTKFKNKITLIMLDVLSPTSIIEAKNKIGPSIDILINNAGILGPIDSNCRDGIDPTELINVFQTNAIGPYLVAKIFFNKIKSSKDKLIVNVSSDMGSISNNNLEGYDIYRASKCALNSLTKSLSNAYKKDLISVVAIHPGWVKTRLGGENAILSVEKAIQNIVELISKLNLKDSGTFLSYDGIILPW